MTYDAATAAHVVSLSTDVDPGPSVVTVGFFDGVHRGHRSIIRRAIREARNRAVRAAAVTFDRHPMEVLKPGSQPGYLMSLERRVRTLVGLGLDLVLVVPFTLEFSQEDPEAFVDSLLVRGLEAVKVIVGANFRFGHRATGSIATLNELGATRGFDAEAVSLLHLGQTPISSTQVREHLARGDVAWARQALGEPYWLDGTVVRGEGRGAGLGIPTANVEVDPRMIVPARGVYAGWVEAGHGASRRPAVTNIGTRPTFDGRGVTIETHVLDVDLDLYGRHLSVGFADRLRDEQRFEGPDQLVAQIRADIDAGRALLAGG